MPKSYELKLREAEERRRPAPKQELYKAIEETPQRMILGFDHPETLVLEMQTTWVEDMFTISHLFDHLLSETRALDVEYKRKPLRCNYKKGYVWYDRHILRPRIQDRDLVMQDYGIEPGFCCKLAPFYTSERMWGMPMPQDPRCERPLSEADPMYDANCLKRIDDGPPTARHRLFCFPYLGHTDTSFVPLAQKMHKDYAVYSVLQVQYPSGTRETDEGYPNGEFAIEVWAETLAKEMKKGGSNFFFGHAQGAHFAYYTAKVLKRKYGVKLNGLFVSNYYVPAAEPVPSLETLRDRTNVCIPLRVFSGMIKQGRGVDSRLGYKSHMGMCLYQNVDFWPSARCLLADHWLTKEFPLPGADEPLDCPVAAFYGRDDTIVALDMVQEWKGMTAEKSKFNVRMMDGGHHWFTDSTKRTEDLARELAVLMKKL